MFSLISINLFDVFTSEEPLVLEKRDVKLMLFLMNYEKYALFRRVIQAGEKN
jgi:hypothetical protein